MIILKQISQMLLRFLILGVLRLSLDYTLIFWCSVEFNSEDCSESSVFKHFQCCLPKTTRIEIRRVLRTLPLIILDRGAASFAVPRGAAFRQRFSEVCFVSENGFWIYKSASFYQISGDRACQNWCRIVIFRDRHFPKKCQKIKILKNKIFENFSNFQLKNMKKRRKIKKNFPRPSGELKALAGRAKFIPGCD